jgi:hypothetical protein
MGGAKRAMCGGAKCTARTARLRTPLPYTTVIILVYHY